MALPVIDDHDRDMQFYVKRHLDRKPRANGPSSNFGNRGLPGLSEHPNPDARSFFSSDTFGVDGAIGRPVGEFVDKNVVRPIARLAKSIDSRFPRIGETLEDVVGKVTNSRHISRTAPRLAGHNKPANDSFAATSVKNRKRLSFPPIEPPPPRLVGVEPNPGPQPRKGSGGKGKATKKLKAIVKQVVKTNRRVKTKSSSSTLSKNIGGFPSGFVRSKHVVRMPLMCDMILPVVTGVLTSGRTVFTIQRFLLGAGCSIVHPWLASMATHWELYKYRRLKFKYVRGANMLSTSQYAGQCWMALTYDVSDPVPDNSVMLQTIENVVPFAPYENKEISVDMRRGSTRSTDPFHVIYNNTDEPTIPPGKSTDDYYHGALYVATEGMPAAGQIGSLWCEFEIDMIRKMPVEGDTATTPYMVMSGTASDASPQAPINDVNLILNVSQRQQLFNYPGSVYNNQPIITAYNGVGYTMKFIFTPQARPGTYFFMSFMRCGATLNTADFQSPSIAGPFLLNGETVFPTSGGAAFSNYLFGGTANAALYSFANIELTSTPINSIDNYLIFPYTKTTTSFSGGKVFVFAMYMPSWDPTDYPDSTSLTKVGKLYQRLPKEALAALALMGRGGETPFELVHGKDEVKTA